MTDLGEASQPDGSTIRVDIPRATRRPHPTDSPWLGNVGPAIWLIVLHVLALGAPFVFLGRDWAWRFCSTGCAAAWGSALDSIAC